MFWSGLYFKGRDMETVIEQKKTNSLAEWAREGQGYEGYKTPMEEMAEQAIKSTQKAQYYNNLPAVKAIPEAQRKGVMDSYVSYFQNSQSFTQYYAQNRFMGYAFLSYLAQDAMISRGVHTLADEMTREWGELTTKEKEHENIVQEVTDEMERLEVQNKFKEAALKTGFFGGCLVFLDVREDPNVPLEDIELEKPLFKEGMDDFNKSKLLNKHLVGLRVIEPINLAPGTYNSIDPTAADFFEPEHFYVLGRKIHRSRFLYFADNIPPQVLKPVYLFFGIPLAQLAFTYVQDFYKAKEVCTRILQKFSCSAISTDIEKLIYANGKNAVKDRISTIAKYRDNDSILVLDKENEEFSQTNTPLSGLKEMWYASLELIPVIFGVPATKLLEISPSGFNSTGEFEMRNFYDSVHTKQTNVFDAPIKRLLEIICYTKGLDPDVLSWAWKSLFKMSERESAEVNRMEADTAQIYYNMGVVGNDDIAKRLINDKDSGYNNIQIPERIDPFQIGEDDTDLTEGTEETEKTEESEEKEGNGHLLTKEDLEKTVTEDSDVFDPFPSEHAARVKDPSEFEEGSFRRKNIANGVDIIMGKLKGSDKMEVQTYRFDKKVFTEEQAKEWLKSHKADNKMFEPAVKDETPKKKVGLLNRILGIFDADRWITIHPPHGNKEDKGVPLKIGENGEVKAGAGGKFTGRKLGEIKKKASSTTTAKTTNKETTEKNQSGRKGSRSYALMEKFREAEEKRKKQKEDYKKVVEEADKRLKDNKEYQDLEKKINAPWESFSREEGITRYELRRKRDDLRSQTLVQVEHDLGYDATSYISRMGEERRRVINELSKTIKDDIKSKSININDFLSSISVGDSSAELETLENKIKESKNKMESIRKEKGLKAFIDPEYRKADMERMNATWDKIKIKKKYGMQIAEKVSSYLKKNFGTNFKVNITKTTLPEITKKMQETLFGCLSEDWKNTAELEIRKARGRANCGWGIINGEDDIGTMIHEYAHYLEENNPDMLANSLAFLKYRTEGEKTSRLKTITGVNYRNNEKTRPDKFFSPYCGKVYASGRNPDYVEATASEVMSMGMEELFTNPVGFAKNDPEYFNFVIANMRGLL